MTSFPMKLRFEKKELWWLERKCMTFLAWLPLQLGPERVFPRICLPKILAKFGWTLWCEFLLKPFVLCVEGPNCSENSWEVFGWFFAIERLFRSPMQSLRVKKKKCFCANFGREKLLEFVGKCPWITFKRPERAKNFSVAFPIVFRIFFLAFFKPFFVSI